MLHDDAGRHGELAYEEPACGEVVEVVERERLAVQLLDAREQMPPRSRLGVEGGALVRVLSVGQVEHLLERQHERLGERFAVGEPGRDRRLVRRGRRERLRGQLAPRVERQLARGAQLVEHEAVPVGARHGGHEGEVLGGGAQHRRAADVDHLDGLLLADPELGDHRGERVEVGTDEVERLDPLVGERGEVVGAVAAGEDAAVDARVQRLHAAAEHLGRRGDDLDAGRRRGRALDVLGGAAARHQLEAQLGQAAREVVEAGLVVHGDQRAHSSPTTFGSSRCSTSWIRSRRLSALSPASTGTRSCASTGPVSTPSSTRCTVAPLSATPAAS